MPKALWELIKDIDPGEGRLPLVHTTDVAYFNEIRMTGKLAAGPNADYDDELLLFFFYGRPSYRPHSRANTINAKAFAPVCLIMNRRLLDRCWRIMPFDSGAMMNGELTPPVHPSMKADQFELAVDLHSPMKLISLFFGSEAAYFDGKPKLSVPFDPWTNLTADSYDKLIRNQANTPLDERVSAIEVQLGEDVELLDNVLAIILPKEYLDVPGVLDQIAGWRDPKVLPYDLPESYVPREIIGAIRQRIRDYLYQEGLLG